MDEQIVESCHLCNLKVRIHADKAASARCPKCKGPLGDPKLDHRCGVCETLNRVPRSRLSAARCGKCKELLLPPGPLPRDLILAEAYALIGAIVSDNLLSRRVGRPGDLVGAVEWFDDIPRTIAELAATMNLGNERDRIAALGARAKSLPAKLRPIVFEDSAMLLDAERVKSYLLGDAFDALKNHPIGWRLLKQLRSGETGSTAARHEVAVAISLFSRLVDRFHKTDWDDMATDKARRESLANDLLEELSRVCESWLPRPYKLQAMVKTAIVRLEEQEWAAPLLESQRDTIVDDVRAFLSVAITIVARGCTVHGLGETPAAVWPVVLRSLQSNVLTAS